MKHYLLKEFTVGRPYYDTHIHPEEVLGGNKKYVCDSCHHTHVPSLLERLDFAPFSLRILRALFFYAPKYIISEIRKKYDHDTDIGKELEKAGIERGVIVPVAPINNCRDFLSRHTSDCFIPLGSLDIKNIVKENIQTELQFLVDTHHIKGVKLHPNIQEFYPCPYRNDDELQEKLLVYYKAINELGLYVLIHGGISYTHPDTNQEQFQETNFGSWQNFFDKSDDKEKSFFSLIQTPIVVAHLGHYNLTSVDFSSYKKILETYTHLYFDTAGVGSHVIKEYLEKTGELGLSRLVFGSDALYFDIQASIDRVIFSLEEKVKEISLEKKVALVFGETFREKVLGEVL